MLNLLCSDVGVGLRPPHFASVLKNKPLMPWFEVHSCNYLNGGLGRQLLLKIREQYPLSLHGVSLNLGGVEPLEAEYLALLKAMMDELQPGLVSDHACFTQLGGQHFHDLLPVPFSDEAVVHMAARIKQVQETLECTIAIENLSRYVNYNQVNTEMCQTLTEGQFLTAVSELADCHILLDLNNAYVNSINLNEDPIAFIHSLPPARISEIHLAGFEWRSSAQAQHEKMAVDTHGRAVSQEVFDLYTYACQHLPQVPALIEWDNNLPDFSVLERERKKAQAIADACY